MEIKLRHYLSIYIVDIDGEIDLYNYFKLKEVVLKLMEKQVNNYILNFENVTYIDSSGVGALIFIYSTLKKAEKKLVITNIKGPVKRVIELTKLVGYLPLSDSLQAAIKKINGE